MLEKKYGNAVTIGKVERHKNLAVAPIYAQDSFLEEVLLLEKALQTGNFTITGSTVNTMDVVNDLGEKVLVVGGATIEREGGQKRYSKFPTLVMPNTRIVIPVNCAEQGERRIRGSYGMNTTIVMPSMRAGNVDQDEAWRQIANTTYFLKKINPTMFVSRTGSYIDDVDRNANVEDYLEAIGRNPREGQVGIVAGIISGENRIYYTDFFGRHQILSGVYSKLAKCFGIVARVHEGNADNIETDNLVGFLRKFNDANIKKQKHVGGGDLFLLSDPVEGSVLSYENAPVQVTMREKVGQD